MIKRKTVLLLKSQNTDASSDKYEDLLTTNGFEVKKVKTLVFDFKNIQVLKEKIINNEAYEGIIFSSPRCVQAVYLALQNDKNVIKAWREKYNFAVGEATYTEALNKLGLECDGKGSGNAVNLSKVILEKKSAYRKPFLFPHGNLKTDTLNLELGKEGIEIKGVLVYDTIANPSILKEISDVTDDLTSIPEYVVFFSPSGFHSSIDHLRKIPVDLNKVKLSDPLPNWQLKKIIMRFME
ncbi:uroporphyrinogen-III synthase isoform X2 [Anoplophora glabripennis]|uniref:uroporphyrinogen-III synthase isoform X2 n=1 Tax=Anoplophora glabripennis TaxID=217634 RepID=UPI000873EAE5|nr:uroporphyrinogen-III synthase isoform X2 [Anoplophora glabripennis]